MPCTRRRERCRAGLTWGPGFSRPCQVRLKADPTNSARRRHTGGRATVRSPVLIRKTRGALSDAARRLLAELVVARRARGRHLVRGIENLILILGLRRLVGDEPRGAQFR